jgi:hypothetical protein
MTTSGAPEFHIKPLALEQLRKAAGVLSAPSPSTVTAELPFASNLANCAHGEV